MGLKQVITNLAGDLKQGVGAIANSAIAAGEQSAATVIADQWKEYFYSDALPDNVLMRRAYKRVNKNSQNKGNDNIISNGSIVAVANGQCMMIVDQGKIVELCAQPGEFVYDTSSEPSIFAGNLGGSILESFKTFGKRFTFGGDIPKDQRVYFFNTRELIGNKFGTPQPVPFRVVDRNIGLDIDISVRCNGEYSYKIVDPILFYTALCGNVADEFKRDRIEGQLRSELLGALQPAFAKISDLGIRYSAVPGHATELGDALNEVLSEKWGRLRGLQIVSVGVSTISAKEEDENMIKELQRNATFRDPSMAMAHMVSANANAVQMAAQNEGGAAIGFMAMNMAQNAAGGGGINSVLQQQLAAQNQQQAMQAQAAAAAAPAADSWVCPKCGTSNTAKFCSECGTSKPVAGGGWTCPTCGAVNKGKFCAECGSKKPAGVPQYKCDKCGWEPADPAHPPKFCPECGDPFDDGDIQ